MSVFARVRDLNRPRVLTRGDLEPARLADLPPGPVAGSLCVDPPDPLVHRCRAFQLSAPAYEAFVEAGPGTVTGASQTEWVTPDGRGSRSPRWSPLNDANRNAYPPLVRGGLLAIPEGLFDGPAVERHLERLARAASQHRAGSEEHRRLVADRGAFGAVLPQVLGPAGGGVVRYRPLYRVVTSGRVYHVGGGLQSASGAMKAAAYGGAVGARNYDLAESQLWGLRQLMEDAGLPCPALSDLLDRPGGVARFAAGTGVPKKRFKGALFGLIYGAALPEPDAALRAAERLDSLRRGGSHGAWARRSSAPVREVLEGVGLERFEGAYRDVYAAVRPVSDEVCRWRRFLAFEFVPDRASRRRGDLYLYNASGMPWNATRWPDGRERRAYQMGVHAAAHLLQGLEAAYIHALGAALSRRGVPVLANEHDGLVCLGAVRPEDEAEARARSGLRMARLVEKPFSEEEYRD